MIPADETSNYEVLRDGLQTTVVQKLLPSGDGKPNRRRVKGRKNEIKPVALSNELENRASELSDFVEFLAEEIFLNLPHRLRTLSHAKVQNDVAVASKFSVPLDTDQLDETVNVLPPSITDSLTSYGLLEDASNFDRFLEPLLNSYITATTSAPPEYTPADAQSKPEGCEVCGRTQLPLTYHHLIPRAVHEKAVKRAWHAEWELNKVAWLCRACHSYVHRIATNEELAKSLYSIDLLMDREDMQRWATWVSRIRWKAR